MVLNEVKNVPGQQAINNLYSNDLKINGKADRGIFNKLELDDIYNKIGNRLYAREVGVGNTLASYSDWTHVLTNDGYSIWKYPLADIIDDSNNELYYNDIVLTNSGSADSEITDLGFTKVFISDNKKVGTTYTSASSANLDSLSLASITSVVNAIYTSTSASLLYTDVIDGSVQIKSYDTLTNYFEDTDYTVNYSLGTVNLISGSDLYVKVHSSSSSYLISYDIGKSIYVGLSASTYNGFNINLSQNGLGNVYNYYYSSSSFIYFSSLNDYTNNFSVSGNVSWDDSELTGWTTSTVNGTNAYWIKIALYSQGSIAPVAESIYKSTSSIKNILTLTPSQLLNNQYKWGIYNGYIYVTFSNGGLAQNEGVTYIKSTSSSSNKQNFFVYNNELKINYKNATADNSIRPTTLADTSAPNNSIYYSSTQSKLVYKDSGGTVKVLY